MNSMALDTHAYFKKLVATGLNDDQAEAIASGMINGLTDNLATKDELHSELSLLRGDMNSEFALVRSEMGAMEERLEGKIVLLRSDMTSMEERLEGKIALVRSDMVAMEDRLRGEMTGMEDRLRGEMTSMEDRLRGEIGELRGELRGEMNELRAEMGAMEARLIRWSAVGLLTVIAVNLAMMGVMFNLLQP